MDENIVIASMSMLEMIPRNKCKVLDYECNRVNMKMKIIR
jgi:hypothetical protein